MSAPHNSARVRALLEGLSHRNNTPRGCRHVPEDDDIISSRSSPKLGPTVPDVGSVQALKSLSSGVRVSTYLPIPMALGERRPNRIPIRIVESPNLTPYRWLKL